MAVNPIQDFLSQMGIPFLGDNLMRKYENEKSPFRADLYSTEQLEQYAISLASSITLSAGPLPDQLIRRLDENEAILEEVRNLLVESAQENNPVSPAGEWLIDNFYVIEEQIQIGKKHFPKDYSETLPQIAKGSMAGLPRVYQIAVEIIMHSDGRVDLENLYNFVKAFQKISNLNLGEIWAIPIMLRLAIIENLRRLAGAIARDRIHRNLADYWADRMIGIAEKDPKSLIVITADMARSNPPMSSSFVAELTRRLLGKGPALTLPLTWVEQRLSEAGLTTNVLVHQDTQKQAADQVSISNSIGSLRFINNTDWREFVEKTSEVEKILREDIDGVYGQMNFQTRDHYRHRVENIAKRSQLSELKVARLAIDLAKEKAKTGEATPRNSHVGYYLIGPGKTQTESMSGIRWTKLERIRKSLSKVPFSIYAGAIIILSLILTSLLIWDMYNKGVTTGWLIIIGIITLLATSHTATALVNWLATIIIPPEILPRMDFSNGIPDESRTLVAVPALYDSVEELEHLIENMEVRYLSNKLENLHFVLLTDFRDASTETTPKDKALLDYARKRIEELNKKYRGSKGGSFFLFHRPRRWNEDEQVWMAYERKRGKLGDLNAVLRGGSKDRFQLMVGDFSLLDKVKYVLTLDADTQLPRETAWKLIATIAHPLNQPYFDAAKNLVVEGYGILQPRVATNLANSSASWYARIFGNEAGIDPYTRVISDVYQDALQEGSFIGKGIYDVDSFEKTLNNRFPENRILSHDLLEGCHARSGLINDVQLYEEYPSSYLADMKRRHRWIRGDWQIGRWLLPKVPAPDPAYCKNQLTGLSRWKIFDNLRRSLVPPSLLLLLLFGWLISGHSWFWTFTVIGIIITPSALSFLWDLYKKQKDVSWLQHTAATIESFVNHLVQHTWSIITLPYETYQNIDAIIRTNWRVMISHKGLLQWDPANNHTSNKTISEYYSRMWIGPAFGLLLLVLPLISWPAFIIASPVLLLWMASPFLAWAISLPQARKSAEISHHQKIYLRALARKTWAYFENFMGPEDHWLPIDNYQEIPVPKTAHRTSPTNVGVSLLSALAAHDFGYITTQQLVNQCTETLSTLQNMERFKGHFYNWYDTQTLDPLFPRYVSTVDSGNLAACLLILKEGLLSLKGKPLIPVNLQNGLIDTIRVLAEKLSNPEPARRILNEAMSSYYALPLTADSSKDFLEKLLASAKELQNQVESDPESEASWWIDALISQATHAYEELNLLTFWMNAVEPVSKLDGMKLKLNTNSTLNDIAGFHNTLLPALEKLSFELRSTEELEWLSMLKLRATTAQEFSSTIIRTIDLLAEQCKELSDYEYDFLYDKTQQFLSIGYNAEDHKRDVSYYDLLGSEARLGVYVAIAQGKIPQESWFALGRQLSYSSSDPVLISWSGSMFEYLMPLLVMPTFESTLLDQTHKGAVKRQIEYGRRRGLPWGISEACYNMIHANMDYQYSAFGVPGLGIKRGLAKDFVITPYASALALMVEPDEAYENLKELSSEGFEGRWGFYESIDYTPARLQRGQSHAIVKTFMTHHQGMSLLALTYLLLDQPMQKRFLSELQFQTSLLLLQEKIPLVSSYFSPSVEVVELQTEAVNTELRIFNTANTPVPEVELLSNGRYHVMVNNSGGGYSRWKDMAVTRWREDGTCDHWGSFCYIRDLETYEFWSTTYQPTLKTPENYEVIFSQGRAEFRRRNHNIGTYTEVVVSPEDDVEIRRLHIKNHSRKRRFIEITSYTEVVINQGIAEMLHPSFSNLFVQTEINDTRNAILCTRRPRSVDERPSWMFHLMKTHEAEVVEVTYETSRDQFIGRGNTIVNPQALTQKTSLGGHEGSVLDPIVAIQYRIQLKPYESITIDMVYGISHSRMECSNLIEKYQEKPMIDRAFELAWTHSNVVLRQINATATDAVLFCKLAGSIIYSNASYRADPGVIIKNQRGQSGLWSHSISGDWPIVLLQIEDSENIEMVEKLAQAHAFWRLKGLVVDLVIWNEDHGGYRQVLQNQILSLITPTRTSEEQTTQGNIYIRSAEQLSNEDRILFQTVARIILSDKMGTLEGQLNRRKKIKTVIAPLTPQKTYSRIESSVATPDDLEFFNGIGGFSVDGKEYVMITSQDQRTPAPWSNVIANQDFGTIISESGQSYTWYKNAHELRLTPWNNDPVTDLGGEHFYIRDEETGRFWSPTPLPARGKSPYVTRHGFGYTVFEHEEDGIYSEMFVYVDPSNPVKYTTINIQNRSGRTRQLTVTGYVEWVLGDLRHKTMMHIISDLDLNSSAILARNSYSSEFGHLISFFDVNNTTRTITTDREEFIGRNGTVMNPEAMRKSKLSGKTGAALDPCAVIQVAVNLEDGEGSDIVYRMGTSMEMHDLTNLMRQNRGSTAAKEVLAKAMRYWENLLSTVSVECPDPSINLITNGWLNYQTLSSRLWARTGYYQSSGAYGFRDQLQDVISLLHIDPAFARRQIILCASRQFVEGDVQHWWHPPVGRGVRTRCSDDYLWLPYVTSRYVLHTGDAAVLDENIQYLESRSLAREEHSYYDLPIRSEKYSSLYAHCSMAIEYGMQFGEHGLPLIGSGDWNDGMDRVGTEGKGESVWLAWFLYDTIMKFMELAHLRGDFEWIDRFKIHADTLKKNIEKHAWDGDWYRRAYFDDGEPLGSKKNPECKIDSIAQSWAILSKAGDKDRSLRGLTEAEKQLVKKEHKIIQLFDPPFDSSDMNPGYIKGYVPGVRENGGQYTHAAIWMVMAFAMVRDKSKMWELLQMINPILHADSKESMHIYKVEPYVVAADIYAVAQHTGRGGWTWYTGSAGWMYQLIIEYVFGLTRKANALLIRPCLPKEWDKVTIRYKFHTTLYIIEIHQQATEMEDVIVIVDGVESGRNLIPLMDDGTEHHVDVKLVRAKQIVSSE